MSNVLPDTLIPIVLSGQLTETIQTVTDADWTLAGIPFLLKPTDDSPYVRETSEYQRQQFDNSREAGENSFGRWWLRSQSTFHGGQGQRFLDGSDPAIARTRFFESNHAYPHDPGELAIAGQVTSAVATRKGAEQVTWSGTQRLVTMSTTTNQVHVQDLPTLANQQDITLGASGVPAAMCTDGTNVYVAIADSVYRVVPGSPGVATRIHGGDIPFSGGPVVLGFAKQRLILTVGPKIWELDPNPGGPPTLVHTVHYTNPVTGWAYTAVADGPDGVYVSGFSGPQSHVSRMSVTESAGTVVLGPPIVQLTFPPAEIVRDIFFYVSSQFAAATTSGVRVGAFTPYAQLQVGELMVGQACHTLAGSSTLIWVGSADSIWWVDLATPISASGTFAHSRMSDGVGASTSDAVNGLTVLPGDDDLVFGTTEAGRLLSQPTFSPASTGTVTTSWARFDTTEPKKLFYLTVEGDVPMGTVTIEAISGQTVSFDLFGQDRMEFSCTALPEAVAFRITVELTSGTLRSYQFKALPTARRFRDLVLPLELTNFETTRHGQPMGYDGYAKDRLLALESLAESGAPIAVRDLAQDVSMQAVIRRVQFVQTVSPASTNSLGGMVNVTLGLV